MAGAPVRFDRASLERAFARLGQIALNAGKIVEISVYGGSALILTLNHRPATQDVDAVFERDRTFVRAAAASIADEFGWDADWLNDGVKGFLSAADAAPDAKVLFGSFPSEEHVGLRVFVASPSYLFAMKCMAMRIGGEDRKEDIDDIRRLARHLGIDDVEKALNIVMRYYPAGRMAPKTRFGLEEIFSAET